MVFGNYRSPRFFFNMAYFELARWKCFQKNTKKKNGNGFANPKGKPSLFFSFIPFFPFFGKANTTDLDRSSIPQIREFLVKLW